jgi:hypothetical protein
MISKAITSFLVACACGHAVVSAGIVAVIPAFKATYPAGKIGGSSAMGLPANYISIPPADEYYLDYEVSFDPGWEWVRGGKLPGLVGGSHTSGCNDIVPNGWSARFMWRAAGLGQVYLYHQDRKSGCGDEFDFPGPGNFSAAKPNRITEHVVINTPGQKNGVVEAWFNGAKVVSLTNIQLRGNVAANTARIDQVSLQTFYGGSTTAWAPSKNTQSSFKGFVVRTDLPDFTRPFSLGQTGLEKAYRAGDTGADRSFTFTYLGSGSMPELPRGAAGQRLSVFDLHGRLLRILIWNESGSNWKGWTEGQRPSRPGILMARIATEP